MAVVVAVVVMAVMDNRVKRMRRKSLSVFCVCVAVHPRNKMFQYTEMKNE